MYRIIDKRRAKREESAVIVTKVQIATTQLFAFASHCIHVIVLSSPPAYINDLELIPFCSYESKLMSLYYQ